MKTFASIGLIALLLTTSTAAWSWDGRWTEAKSGQDYIYDSQSSQSDAGIKERPQKFFTPPTPDFADVDPAELSDYFDRKNKDYAPYALARITRTLRYNNIVIPRGYYLVKAGALHDGSPKISLKNLQGEDHSAMLERSQQGAQSESQRAHAAGSFDSNRAGPGGATQTGITGITPYNAQTLESGESPSVLDSLASSIRARMAKEDNLSETEDSNPESVTTTSAGKSQQLASLDTTSTNNDAVMLRLQPMPVDSGNPATTPSQPAAQSNPMNPGRIGGSGTSFDSRNNPMAPERLNTRNTPSRDLTAANSTQNSQYSASSAAASRDYSVPDPVLDKKERVFRAFVIKQLGKVVAVVPVHEMETYKPRRGEKAPKQAVAWMALENERPVLKFYYKQRIYSTYFQ